MAARVGAAESGPLHSAERGGPVGMGFAYAFSTPATRAPVPAKPVSVRDGAQVAGSTRTRMRRNAPAPRQKQEPGRTRPDGGERTEK